MSLAESLQALRQWFRESTDKTVLSSPWVGYQTGYGFRCLCMIALIGLHFQPFLHSDWRMAWAGLKNIALWYCWVASLPSLLSSRWRGFSGTFLFSMAVYLSLERIQVDLKNFYTTSRYTSGLVLFVILQHSNVHPLSFLFVYVLWLVDSYNETNTLFHFSWLRFFPLTVLAYDAATQFMLTLSFIRTFTLRVQEVHRGLECSEAIDILRGRSSRGCTWLIGLISWLMCLVISVWRSCCPDLRCQALYGEGAWPPWPSEFALIACLVLLAILGCRGQWRADLAMTSFCCLPQVWLYGECRLLRDVAPIPRDIYFWDLLHELWHLRWVQGIVAIQSLMQAGCHPLLPCIPFTVLTFPPDIGVHLQKDHANRFAILLSTGLLLSILINFAVDFYLRDMALKELQNEDPEIEMGQVDDPSRT